MQMKKEDIVNSKKRMNRTKTGYFLLMLILVCLTWLSGAEPILFKNEAAADAQSLKNPGVIKNLEEAKAKLQAGVNSWNLELLRAGRDLFINCFVKEKPENAYLLYYVALADYRLATFYLSSNNKEEAEKYTVEAQKYLEKSMAADPSFGESYAFYAYLLGYEIALHPERAMNLGMASFEYFSKALEREPNNPRINLLKGTSLFYTPEAYGGGADNALEYLKKAVGLFEKEVVTDPLRPSWGKEEAYTFLGMAYGQKKEYEKAREMFRKALEINPDFGLAKTELAALDKKEPV